MQYQTKYEQKRLIGQGSYGKCFLVRHREEDRLYVAKRIAIEEQSKRSVAFKEIEVMRRLKNPFIVSYKESFLSAEGIIIVMQYCPNGDLKSVINKCKAQGKALKQSVIKSWCLQLCIGLQYLHTNKLLHRDLKPENILLSATNSIKIADFGTSKLMDSVILTHTIVGTYCYMSPQVCKQQPYSYQSDIWSLGCILFELCNLVPPFQSKYFAQLLESIIHTKVREFTGNYSNELKDLIFGFLKQRKERCRLDVVMTSPFFISILKEEFSNSVTKAMVDSSELYIQRQRSSQPEEIKEQIEDDDDYVLGNKLQEEATIQSISNFKQSIPQKSHRPPLVIQSSIKGHEEEKVVQNSIVLAFSATFEEVDMFVQIHPVNYPLGSLDTNITIPPKLKYK